jgi:iron complex outermembrane receptor protein
MIEPKAGRLARRLLLATVCAMPTMLPAPAMAQAEAQQAEPEAEAAPQVGPATDEQGVIVVTGSRVARSGFNAPTPTTVLGADDIAASAPTNLADLVNTLPAVKATLTPATASNNSNFGSGNYLDLRGLGPTRTLVLVDRRRFVPSSIYGFVDVNVIPQAIVGQVEVVTGGASAAWGSDAVAGVVNFQLDHSLRGFRATVQGETSEHDDHQGYLISLGYGTSFGGGRGALIAGVEFADNNGVLRQDSRDWGNRGYRLITNPAATPTNDEPLRLIAADVRTANASFGGVITSGPLRGIQFAPGGAPIPFNFGTALTSTTMIGGDGVRSNANAVLETPLERRSAYGRLSYDISDALTVYAEGSYARSNSQYPLALPGVNIDTITIQRDNAYLPQSVRDAMVANNITSFTMGRYSSDYAIVQAELNNETWRGVVGAEGQLGGSWSWDAYYTHGETTVDIIGRNNRITANYNLAIDAVVNPATGAIVCRSTLTNPANGCVPVNLFGAGSVSPQALDYMMGTAQRSWYLKQDAAALTVRGDPFSTWAGPVSLASGVEYRRESANVVADARSAASGFGVGAQIPWRGDVEVVEGFAEVVVPLLHDQPLARALDLNLAARYTDYSTSGGVVTWKIGATYEVDGNLRFRATRSRDIRAPALAELFQGASQVNSNVIDPQTGQTVSVRSPVLGNPALQPEKADTLALGVVYQPPFIPRLRASLDYYDIRVNGAITSLTAQAIVDRCQIGQQSACDEITRVNGQITNVNVVPLNLQSVSERGVDFELSYRTPITANGSLDLRALVTYVDSLKLIDGGVTQQLAGSTEQPVIQGLGGVPHWRFNVRAGYETDRFSVNLTGRYIGGGVINNLYTPKDINILSVNGRLYFDLAARWDILSRGEQRLQFFAGVENLFDQDPPIAGGGFNTSATVRSLYDQIGRVFTAGIRVRY